MSGYALTPRARGDLQAIWPYTADRWNIEQADRYLQQIRQAMEFVAIDPRRGRSCDHIRPDYLRYPAGSHVLFFRQGQDGIVVVRVLHQSMDFERHF
jgi:toxin ParE1/3/4